MQAEYCTRLCSSNPWTLVQRKIQEDVLGIVWRGLNRCMFEHLISRVTDWSLCGIWKVSIWLNGFHVNKQMSSDLTAVTTWPVPALSLQDPRSVKPTLYWVKKIPPYSCSLLAYAWVNSSRKDMDMVRCDFRCADPLESVDISVTSLWSLAAARAKACCNFAKTKTVTLVLFYLQIVCLEGSVEVYVDTFPLFFVLFCSPDSHVMKVKHGPAAMKVGGRVSPDITSRCRLDSVEPEPWSRAWV